MVSNIPMEMFELLWTVCAAVFDRSCAGRIEKVSKNLPLRGNFEHALLNMHALRGPCLVERNGSTTSMPALSSVFDVDHQNNMFVAVALRC